jgi:protein O-mannosyl-transferase
LWNALIFLGLLLKALLRHHRWFYAIALIIAVVLLYYPGMWGSFFFDDKPSIVDNPALRLFSAPHRSFSDLLLASAGSVASPLGRPLSMASFALNMGIFGDAPFSFKLVNLLIHLANGGLIFVLTQQLWPHLTGRDKSFLPSFWVTAVWLLHPINLSPVLFVVQRMTSMAAFFSLAALILYLYGRQTGGSKGWMAIAAGLLVCWPAAILSKETALLLPLFILACEWLVLNSFRSVSLRVLWLGMFILGVAVAGILAMEWRFVAGGYRFRDFTLLERLMTEARVLWYYLLQFFLPWPDLFSLHHDDFPISRSLFSPLQTLWAIAGWLAVIVFVIYRHKRSPLLAFALVWFLIAHLLESTILPLEIAYEHRNYLATLGILIWLSDVLFSPPTQESGRVPKLVFAASFAVFCALVTTLRANQWGDEYRRATLEAAIHPNSGRANYEAATAVMDRTFFTANGGNAFAYQTVQFHLKRAAELDRNDKASLIGLLYLDCLAGYPNDTKIRAKLLARLSTTPFSPGDRGIVQGLSQLLVKNDLCLNDDEVSRLLNAALSNPMADQSMRGMLYAVAMDYAAAKIGSVPLALSYAKAAVESDPGSIALRINLVHVLLASGDLAAARKEYAALVKLPMPPVHRISFEQLRQKMNGMESNASK